MRRRCRPTLSQSHRSTRVTSQVSALILETGVDRGGGAAGTIISLVPQCTVRNEDRGHRGRALSSGGVPLMRTVEETRFRRAPWGRKKHLLPLPILSVVLMVTAMASPGLLRMTVTIIDDSNLTLTTAVQNVVHPSGPDGKIVGIMRVTNHASTDIQLIAASVRIQSVAPEGAPDGRLDTTITINVPLTVSAGAIVNAPFSGPFSGNVLSLSLSDSFLVTPLITWFTVLSSGSLAGPFTYAQAKVCSGPGPLPSNPYWVSTFCRDA